MCTPHEPTLCGCRYCGLVQIVPHLFAGHEAQCVQCGHTLLRPRRSASTDVCIAVTVAALMLYPLGVWLPVLRLQQLGHIHEASIWSASIRMLTSGEWIVGIVVLICSVLIPVAKLLGLLLLSTHWPRDRHHQARLYRWIERLGRWGMIDVLLVAITVAAVKLEGLVEVSPGPGVLAFTMCVGLSMVASGFFDPHEIWQRGSVAIHDQGAQ